MIAILSGEMEFLALDSAILWLHCGSVNTELIHAPAQYVVCSL